MIMPLLPSRYGVTTYSYSLQDAIGRPPNWLIRCGMGILFLIVLSFVFLSWYIEYPETVTARAVISSSQPPIPVHAKAAGRLTLIAEEGTEAAQDETIGIIESIDDPDAVNKLYKKLLKIADIINLYPEKTPDIIMSDIFLPGSINEYYAAFIKALRAQQHEVTDKWCEENLILLKKKLHLTLKQQKDAEKNVDILQKILLIEEKNYKKHIKLHKEEVISDIVLDERYSQFLSRKHQLTEQKQRISNYAAEAANQEINILHHEHNHHQHSHDLQLNLVHRYQTLLSSIEQWQNLYLLTAPIAGRVSYFDIWAKHYTAKPGDEVFMLVPTGAAIIAKLHTEGKNIGRVEIGQEVNIKLDNYPYAEFGLLKGKVSAVTAYAKKNKYIVTAAMPEGLTTSYNKKLSLTEQMQGQAEIITKPLNFLQRVLYRTRSLLKNRQQSAEK
jgi:hypothetical protein